MGSSDPAAAAASDGITKVTDEHCIEAGRDRGAPKGPRLGTTMIGGQAPRAGFGRCDLPQAGGSQVWPVSQLTCRAVKPVGVMSSNPNTIGKLKRRGPIEPGLIRLI